MPISSLELIFLILSLFAFLINSISLAFLRFNRKSKTDLSLSLMALCTMLWVAAYAGGIAFDQHPVLAKSLIIIADYFAFTFVILFLYFSSIFTSLKIKWHWLLWVWPAFAFLLLFLPGFWKNDYLVYETQWISNIGYRFFGAYSMLHSILWLLNTIIAAFAFFRLLLAFSRMNIHFQRAARFSILTISLPIFYRITANLIFDPKAASYDYTPVLISACLLVITLFVRRMKIQNLDILSCGIIKNNFLEGAVVVNEKGVIFDANKSGTIILGEENQSNLIWKNLQDYFPYKRLVEMPVEQNQESHAFLWVNPSQKEFEIHSHPVINSFQELFGHMITFIDVTRINQLLRQTRELSVRDMLTRAYNRRHFEALATKQFANAVRYGFPLSIMMIDLDNLKLINNTYGHLAGDKVLIKATNNFFHEVRDADTVARFDGDEFVILMPTTPLDGAIQVAQRIIRRCRDTDFEFSKEKYVLSVSIGISSWFSKPGEKVPLNHEDLLNQADKALFYSKNSPIVAAAFYKDGTYKTVPPLEETLTEN
ncbi:MAG: diguanylate cyclase [Anaerolineaceae bacterium]|nr:diguanylate cyclase [Anaerolineaceae bacterium]